MTIKERIRDLLVEAVLQSDGGPNDKDDRWQAEDIADDIIKSAAWGDLMNVIDEHYREGFRRARALTTHAEIEPLFDQRQDDLHIHDAGDAEYKDIKAGRYDCVDPDCPDRTTIG